jgi:hypothetical protein
VPERAQSGSSSRGGLALAALQIVSGLAVGYLVILALLAYNSENVESPNPGYVILAIAGGVGFALGLLGMGRRWPRAGVVVCLILPLLAAFCASTFLELDTAG